MLSSCGGGTHYDPLLKYENAGYSAVRVGDYGSTHFTDSPLCSKIIKSYTNFDYYIELVTNSPLNQFTSIEQLKIMDSKLSNVRLIYSNKMLGDVISLSNKVLVLENSGELHEYGTETSSETNINLLSKYSNYYVAEIGENLKTYSVYGRVIAVSSNGKYILVEVPLVWRNVFKLAYELQGKTADAWDYGCAIVNTENYSVNYLYNVSDITSYPDESREVYCAMDVSLKSVYIKSYNLGFSGKSEGGRTSDELRGWWKLDISSLGLSE